MTMLKNDETHGATDCFLLAVAREAQGTSWYELAQVYGISPGGVRPAVERLVRAGLLAQGDAGARNKRRIKTTPRGEAVLPNASLAAAETISLLETDAVLRLAWVLSAIHRSGAVDLLRRASERLHAVSDQHEIEAKSFAGPTYPALRHTLAANRRRAEAEALRKLARELLKGQA